MSINFSQMFFIKKLITSLILPPGILIVIFIIIFFLAQKKYFIRWFSISVAFFIYLLSIEPMSDLLLHQLEKEFSIPQKIEGEAIVILGGGTYISGALSEDTINRLLTGYALHKKTKLPIILSGGNIEGKLTDSKAMHNTLQEIGVEGKYLIEENKSRDTHENAFYTFEICKKRGFKKIILVTSGYHMKRAVKNFNKTGMEVLPYPADSKFSGTYNKYSFLPKLGTFNISIKVIREFIALLVLYFQS